MGMLIPGKMKDGTPIRLRFEDKGERVPGYAKDGTQYVAYTSWFRAESDSFEEQPEIYSQVSKAEADASGEASMFRLANDDLCLEAIGVDPVSLDLDAALIYSEDA